MNTQVKSTPKMGRLKAGFNFVLTLILLAGTLLNFAPARAKTAASNPVVAWNIIAQQTFKANEIASSVQMTVYLAYMHGAVYDAVANIQDGYRPYNLDIRQRPNASVDAAVATAAYQVLAHYIPAQQAALAEEYDAAMAAIPDGKAKNEGVLVGKMAARGMIDLRKNDGLGADIGYTMPEAGPGAWQLPAEQSPHTPWASKLKPFTLKSPDQFRPAPPPALNSREWARDYTEVKEYGSATSASRTSEETEVARFWTTHPALQYNKAFADVSVEHQFDALQTARLFAMGNIVGADALIACLDAKYHYLFWRPMFAIPQGETDSNPNTPGDAAWAPLIGTPNHPEYPSAHGCLTAAVSEVFVEALGTRRIELDLKANLPDQPEIVRHYSTTNQLVREVREARIWGGIHYRFSVTNGAVLGHKVACYALKQDFQPVK